MDRPWAGWRYANHLFGPARSYLPDDDIAMGWLYKTRALIGVTILIVVALRFHQGTRSIVAYFNPVLGGVTEPMLLALFSVVPATAAVVLFTRPRKRDKAFGQMVRYPGRVALICLGIYVCVRLLEQLVGLHNFLVDAGIIIIGGLIYLRYVLFPLRAIYLITVGMCRLGDGHPLLPPIIGAVLAWVVAGQSLLTGHAGTGEPTVISIAVLLGGPLSITALGHVEISRLRAHYTDQFPFRDGPLSSPDYPDRAASAGPSMPSTASAGGQHPEQRRVRGRYPWRLAIVSTAVLGIVAATAGYAWDRFAPPRAVDTALSAIQNGQCIQYRPDQGTTVESLPVIPCSAMHWGQFLGLFSIGDPASAPYPGDTAADQMSYAVCTKAFSQAVGYNPRDYVLWYRRPSQDGWTSNDWSNALCIAEASDSMPFEGSISKQPEPIPPARAYVKPVPLSAVSLSRDSGYSPEPGDPTALPHAEPLTTASNLPPACSAADPSADWFGDSGADADYQVTQGNGLYADVNITIAPLTPAGKKNLPSYLRDLPSTCYSPHWLSFQDGMSYSDDGGFTLPADGTRLLDMGYGKSGSASYLEYWTISDGYLLDFLYAPSTSVTSAREPMRSALETTIRHINRVLHTHLRSDLSPEK